MPPSLNPSKPFGENFIADNDTKAGLLPVFVEIANIQPPRSGEEIMEFLQEKISPLKLLHPDMA